jgi:hypothetical protein
MVPFLEAARPAVPPPGLCDAASRLGAARRNSNADRGLRRAASALTEMKAQRRLSSRRRVWARVQPCSCMEWRPAHCRLSLHMAARR